MKTWRSDDGEASDFSSIDPPPPPPEIDPAIDTVGSSCAESTWLGEKQAERDARAAREAAAAPSAVEPGSRFKPGPNSIPPLEAEIGQQPFKPTIKGTRRNGSLRSKAASPLRPQARPLPGMPVPAALTSSRYDRGPPPDAHFLELARDKLLFAMAGKKARLVFMSLSIAVVIIVLIWGLIVFWAFLGLFLGFTTNGWGEELPECLAQATRDNKTLYPLYVPTCDYERGLTYCNLNQYYFNASIKAFVIIFSYINFLPIPWRLSILWHVFCSRRKATPGSDLYGRPTMALWFNIGLQQRRVIAVLLNLAYALHFLTLANHCIFWEFCEGQQVVGALSQNVPFILSLICAIGGGVLQGKAEDRLIKEHPEIYPPRPHTFVYGALKRWVRGEEKRSLRHSISGGLREFRTQATLLNFNGFGASLTGIEITESMEIAASVVQHWQSTAAASAASPTAASAASPTAASAMSSSAAPAMSPSAASATVTSDIFVNIELSSPKKEPSFTRTLSPAISIWRNNSSSRARCGDVGGTPTTAPELSPTVTPTVPT